MINQQEEGFSSILVLLLVIALILVIVPIVYKQGRSLITDDYDLNNAYQDFVEKQPEDRSKNETKEDLTFISRKSGEIEYNVPKIKPDNYNNFSPMAGSGYFSSEELRFESSGCEDPFSTGICAEQRNQNVAFFLDLVNKPTNDMQLLEEYTDNKSNIWKLYQETPEEGVTIYATSDFIENMAFVFTYYEGKLGYNEFFGEEGFDISPDSYLKEVLDSVTLSDFDFLKISSSELRSTEVNLAQGLVEIKPVYSVTTGVHTFYDISHKEGFYSYQKSSAGSHHNINCVPKEDLFEKFMEMLYEGEIYRVNNTSFYSIHPSNPASNNLRGASYINIQYDDSSTIRFVLNSYGDYSALLCISNSCPKSFQDPNVKAENIGGANSYASYFYVVPTEKFTPLLIRMRAEPVASEICKVGTISELIKP